MIKFKTITFTKGKNKKEVLNYKVRMCLNNINSKFNIKCRANSMNLCLEILTLNKALMNKSKITYLLILFNKVRLGVQKGKQDKILIKLNKLT